MRRLLLRSTLSFALAWTAACADDIPEVVTTGSSSGDASSSGPGPVSADTTVGTDTTEGPVDTTQGTTDSTTSSSSSSSDSSSSGDASSSGSSSGGPTCGSDSAEPGEACDGTDLLGEDCVSQGFDIGTLGCLPDCSAFDTSACMLFSCGNDLLEGIEVCDGTDLAGEDCITQGFDAGTLGCAPDCTAFDTSACVTITCGDDVIDGADVCDGTDLAGETCISQGFDAGTLACAPSCAAFDTSGCIMFACGNGLLEGTETCDGAALAGQDCGTQGFDGGTLGCAADCSAFDTAGCYVCGDDAAAGPEVCDGTDLVGEDCGTQGFDGGTLGCTADCSAFDQSGCYACGDDVAAGPEVCDGTDLLGEDCVTQGLDGGTLVCAASCAAFDTNGCYECGDAVAEGPEECDGADLLGNTCVSLDIGFDGGTLACGASCGYDDSGCTRCGDNAIEGTEVCDGTNLGGQSCQGLGFAFGALGCSDECTTFQDNCVDIITETEPNDDGMVAVATNDFSAPAANGPYTSDVLIAAAINPLGDDDVFAISNPGPGYVIASVETYGSVPGACDVDTQIFLLTNTGLQLATDSDTGIGFCAFMANIVIPPGVTVYARLTEQGDNALIAAYHVHIRIDPVVCGDGLGGPLEQCDDGGNANGDGCSSTCQIEGVITEIEPNGTNPQADATGIVITDDVRIGGAIGAIADQDRFRIDLAAPQFVRFGTFTALNQCNNGFGIVLRVYDAAGVQIIADTGPLTGSGIANCAELLFPLPAGTFYVHVEENGNNAPVPTYVLEVELLGDLGTETEANEDQASANIMGAVSDVYVFGDHSLDTDSDYYAIDVPVNGSSLRLEIIEGDRAVETCEANSIDSRLTLYDSTGLLLVDDDDDGRGFCSQIDGTGAFAVPSPTFRDANAHNLSAGTYYVQVRATAAAVALVNRQFIYRLVATVREP